MRSAAPPGRGRRRSARSRRRCRRARASRASSGRAPSDTTRSPDEPVNEIFLNRSSRAMPSATFELTGRTWYIPSGRSVSAKSSPSSRAPSGVAVAGLTTIGAPTASAGATLCATRFSGKLNGVIPRTGPSGNRRSSPIRDPRDGLGVQAHELVVAAADHLGGPAERGDGAGRLDRRPLERLAALARDQLGVLRRSSRRAGWRCGRGPPRGRAPGAAADSSNVVGRGRRGFLDVGRRSARAISATTLSS